MTMKQYLIACACIIAMVFYTPGCKPSHVPEHLDNAAISAQHDLALDACFNAAVETIEKTGDYAKAQADYIVCAEDADRKFAPKP